MSVPAESPPGALIPSGPGARIRRVVLAHPVFSSFEDPFFRLSDQGRSPVLVVPMDDREASLPVEGLMREFGIAPSGDDGQMLALVCRALSFVTGIRIGDWLPAEVLSSEASWVVDDVYRERALARLNLCLLAWMPRGAVSLDRESLSRAGSRPISPDALASGLRMMAGKVGGITLDESLSRIRQAAEQFAYVEFLRDRLLRGAVRMLDALDRLGRGFRGDGTHRELLAQVRRLASIGLADLQARFDRADAEVADVERVVTQAAAVLAALRGHRDDLYVRCRAWDPLIGEWAVTELGADARTWQLARETYRFLAPRFMTVVEWRSAPVAVPAAGPGMTW